jgi:outer membrane receptor protein involved in Fe transport
MRPRTIHALGALALAIRLSLASGAAFAAAAPESATDADAGRAALDVAATAPAADTQRLSNVEVQGTTVRIDDQAAYTEEARASAQVSAALSAEQIARAGDTDSAAALKRVTGLTLVDGRYIYVRGLGERYSSVLLNGAQIPSPDPTRRVVPLDLFPTDILEGIVVQKTYSPEMPGEFGGGTVQLRLKAIPTRGFAKFSATLGFLDGTTGEEGLGYDGGGRDWTGRDDGTRDLPEDLADFTRGGRFLRARSPLNADGATPQQLEQFGEGLARGGYDVHRSNTPPNGSASASFGDAFDLGSGYRFGYIAALRYHADWAHVDEIRRSYVNSDAGLELDNDLAVEDTQREVDVSGFAALGLELGPDHRLKLNHTLLRQTRDRAQVSTGIDDSQQTQITELEWIENELATTQLSGEHRFAPLHDLGASWQYARSSASREAPNHRRYRYDLDPDGVYRFSARADGNLQQVADLGDDGDNWTVGLKSPWQIGSSQGVTLSAGVDGLSRDRDSSIRSFTFRSIGALARDPELLAGTPDEILTPSTIGPDGFVLSESTRATDNYTASQSVLAQYVSADWTVYDAFRVLAGGRREHNRQRVTTFSIANPNAPPVVSRTDQTDFLPAFSATWLINAESQLRAAYSETLSRPDFRELSPAPFTDPLLDAETIGNPDLETTSIKNYDLRYEYFFSPAEAITVGAFLKEFELPIEKVRLAGSGVLLGLQNAESARNYGIEIDAFKRLSFFNSSALGRATDAAVGGWESWYVGFNYARIRSRVSLDPLQASFLTNTERALQGQSPYVGNIEIGHLRPDGHTEVNLLYNRFGRRIAQVGVQGQPDIYEEPFGQLDLVVRRDLAARWTAKLRLKNLLDPSVRFTQGGFDTRRYEKGRELLLTLEWRPIP